MKLTRHPMSITDRIHNFDTGFVFVSIDDIVPIYWAELLEEEYNYSIVDFDPYAEIDLVTICRNKMEYFR